MSLDHLEGRRYGPFEFEISAAKVAEYVAATGDDADRWSEYAPPSYAGAVLFKAAPAFLFDPELADHARLLIHGEQRFSWPEPWRIGSAVTATAQVEKMRRRGGVTFATFVMDVRDDGDRHVLESKAVFLMSADTPPGGEAAERDEPSPEQRGTNDMATALDGSADPEVPLTLAKSASRADLVRYAAASEDFNPMHWDHRRAADAGVGGVIVHGLLMSAWSMQPATAIALRADPVVDARFRFRLPLHAGEPASVAASVTDGADGLASVQSVVESPAGVHVAATMTIRTGGTIQTGGTMRSGGG